MILYCIDNEHLMAIPSMTIKIRAVKTGGDLIRAVLNRGVF